MEDCAICWDKQPDVELSCKHRFCSDCTSRLARCPLCRTPIPGKEEEEDDFNVIVIDELFKFLTNVLMIVCLLTNFTQVLRSDICATIIYLVVIANIMKNSIHYLHRIRQ